MMKMHGSLQILPSPHRMKYHTVMFNDQEMLGKRISPRRVSRAVTVDGFTKICQLSERTTNTNRRLARDSLLFFVFMKITIIYYKRSSVLRTLQSFEQSRFWLFSTSLPSLVIVKHFFIPTIKMFLRSSIVTLLNLAGVSTTPLQCSSATPTSGEKYNRSLNMLVAY